MENSQDSLFNPYKNGVDTFLIMWYTTYFYMLYPLNLKAEAILIVTLKQSMLSLLTPKPILKRFVFLDFFRPKYPIHLLHMEEPNRTKSYGAL